MNLNKIIRDIRGAENAEIFDEIWLEKFDTILSIPITIQTRRIPRRVDLSVVES